MAELVIVPVILCGGSGTRLWPLSRKMLPKQFLPLVTKRSMFQETALRARSLLRARAPYVVCNDEHRFLVAEQLRELECSDATLLLEPVGRNTAPALAAAALAIADTDPNSVMLVLPADHVITELNSFREAANDAAVLAVQGLLVTFGIVPSSPETAYGYIHQGAPMTDGKSYRVAKFIEKPDAKRAQELLDTGNHYWNSGMFAMTAARYLEELLKFRPDIVAAVKLAWNGRSQDMNFCRLEASAFGACPADSIDYAVMEKPADAAMVPSDLGWSDLGSWTALWDISDKDSAGNATRGDVDLNDTRNNYVRAESRLVSLNGVDNLIVVETSDAVLIAHRDKSQTVKDVVARLDSRKRTEHLNHRRVYRPWGYYESIDSGETFQVKRLMVKPGAALSLQLHHHRSEHWVVVSGIATVTCDERIFDLTTNQSTYIPKESKHRLENSGTEPLFVIEVQAGDYLGEDDIVRFEDRYSRAVI